MEVAEVVADTVDIADKVVVVVAADKVGEKVAAVDRSIVVVEADDVEWLILWAHLVCRLTDLVDWIS